MADFVDFRPPAAPVGSYKAVPLGGIDFVERGPFGKPCRRAFWPVNKDGKLYQAEKIVSADGRCENGLAQLIEEITGKPIEAGDRINLADLIDMPCDIVVTKSADGQIGVSSVKPAAK
jgi:hypothetical protein